MIINFHDELNSMFGISLRKWDKSPEAKELIDSYNKKIEEYGYNEMSEDEFNDLCDHL